MDEYNEDVIKLIRAWKKNATLTTVPISNINVKWVSIRPNKLTVRVAHCTPAHAVSIAAAVSEERLCVKFVRVSENDNAMLCHVFAKSMCFVC